MARRPVWTLRRRLVVAIVALLATVSIIIGAVSTLALNGYLLSRLDSQITSATNRFQIVVDRPDNSSYPQPPSYGNGYGGDKDPGAILPLAGLPPETLGAFVRSDGTLDGTVLAQNLDYTALTDEQDQLLLAVANDGQPVSVDLGGDLGMYRIVATTTTNGETIVIGMPLSGVTSTVLQLVLVIGIVTASGLLLAFLVGTAIVRIALRPLDRVAATAAHVAELPLERGEVALAVRVPEEDSQPDTEVGQVGAAINRMLGHISNALTAREASEKKVRTFVADASHELRTPLASIRGYAELTRRGGHDLPDDVVRAMSRIESESVRMTSLVEDLLLLARLDDGRELEAHPVDLGALLTDAVSDAHAAGQDHQWLLELPPSPVVVPGDSPRLHQVMVNLLGNARTHTPAGTVVTSAIAIEGDTAVISVRDDGPGIAAELQPTLFERFVRGDTSRSRVAGSTGLGLAIVAAVVEAHGGTVSVTSSPGATEFRVALPLSVLPD